MLKLKKIFIIFIFILSFDLIITNLILKKFEIYKSFEPPSYTWRTKSDIFHHTFKKNQQGIEDWNFLTKTIYTNSLGFRDKEIREIQKISKKKRILLLGDSFIEGAGYNYEYTVAGLLDDKLKPRYEILNAGVGSYSPGAYFLKTKYFIDQGYKFDYALVFLDLSDIFDELDYNYNASYSKILHTQKKKIKLHKKTFYQVGNFFLEHTLTFKFFLLITDKSEQLKNFLKLKYKASKEFKKNFFLTSKEDALFYRMITIDRGAWTKDADSFKFVKEGFNKSEFFLRKLFNLLNENEVKSYLIVYPWPHQIYYNDNYHEPLWKDFANKNNINFLSLYEEFNYSSNKRQIILDNFIFGDIHWNKKGNQLISDGILNQVKF